MLRKSLQMFLWMMFLTGIVYPLFITLLAQMTMPFKANGSFITFNQKIVGSRLIGQKFELEKYFWGRPSASDYQGLSSGGSNLGQISLVLKNLVINRKELLKKMNPLGGNIFPSDLLFASGSGLDPHITVEAAYFQKNRIAKARHLDESSILTLTHLIENRMIKRTFGFLGKPCLNVLEMNLALDEIFPAEAQK